MANIQKLGNRMPVTNQKCLKQHDSDTVIINFSSLILADTETKTIYD